MTIGVLELFSIGIGPSSSHTVGPMRAARYFRHALPVGTASLELHTYGSLAATGEGHGTYDAILAGLMGFEPETADLRRMRGAIAEGRITLHGCRIDYTFHKHPFTVLDFHPNGLRFVAFSSERTVLADETWYSIGGGFVVRDGEPTEADASSTLPLPFSSGGELLERCDSSGLSIAGVMRANELSRMTEGALRDGIGSIHRAMTECITAGLVGEGILPGGLQVPRRARAWHDTLMSQQEPFHARYATEWLNVIALAVNEENAAGGRVVTAPTNGAAGIVPAVLWYAVKYLPPSPDAVERFLLTAAAIGVLYKERASISGAEVGCQGEVGSASSMAAAGLAELLGASPRQVENAAEIAMEHNLGLSCDPVGGLVQIPCIERNAIAAAKAVNAATMAMRGNGTHRVSLDQVIETMRQTGADMNSKYKETSLGGLAVNVVEC
ncbi:MAG TPA: L-serine ammonia-lyase [Lacisediminihabitans sp.]|uniref:L-serine ammonia-lyase n=1 Tax=Lacisediminihabitans sp. TaxID=2787631 RepID=UPI002ED8B287